MDLTDVFPAGRSKRSEIIQAFRIVGFVVVFKGIGVLKIEAEVQNLSRIQQYFPFLIQTAEKFSLG